MLGGSSYHHHNPKPTLILQVTRETLSSRAGAIVLEPIIFRLQIADKSSDYLQIANKLPEPIVCDQGGGTPLDRYLDQVAEEEAKARQVEPGGKEEMWCRGSNFPARRIAI